MTKTPLSFSSHPLDKFAQDYNIDPKFVDLVSDLMLMSKFYVKNGMWIAGGCFGRMMRGEKLESFNTDLQIESPIEEGPYFRSGDWDRKLTEIDYQRGDIDIFFRDQSDIRSFLNFIMDNKEAFPGTRFTDIQSRFAITFILNTDEYKIKTQLVNCDYFKSAEDVLKNFDLSCCMIATDGIDVIFEDMRSVSDSLQKRLRFNKEKLYNVVKEGEGNSFIAMRRLQKYLKQGFTIDNHELATFIDFIQTLPKAIIEKSSKDYYWLPKEKREEMFQEIK